MPRAARYITRALMTVWLLILLAFVLAFGDESDLYGGTDEPRT